MNEIIQSLHNRKSCRVFTDQIISDEAKAIIYDAAIAAPTAGNQTLYTILDITEQALKDKLAVLCDNQPFIKKASMVSIFLADCRRWFSAYENAGLSVRKPGVGDLTLAIEDAVIAAQNSVVAADALGIGTCYIGDITENESEVRKLLNLDEFVYPATMIVYGYPTDSQLNRPKPIRFARKYLVQENQYRKLEKAEQIEMFIERGDIKTAADFPPFIEKFCKRKYMTDFSLDMQKSVQNYLNRFSE